MRLEQLYFSKIDVCNQNLGFFPKKNLKKFKKSIFDAFCTFLDFLNQITALQCFFRN